MNSCEDIREPSRSTAYREFIDELRNQLLLKKRPAPWSSLRRSEKNVKYTLLNKTNDLPETSHPGRLPAVLSLKMSDTKLTRDKGSACLYVVLITHKLAANTHRGPVLNS